VAEDGVGVTLKSARFGEDKMAVAEAGHVAVLAGLR